MVTTMSDDNNPSSEPAPDGAGATATPPATTDIAADAIAREQKALRQRQELGKKLDDQLDENRLLRERMAVLEGKSKAPAEKPASTAPEWFSEAMGPLNERLAELEQMNTARTRGGIVDSILARVPDGNRENAKTMLAGLEATKQIDLTSPTVIADAVELLSSTSVMVDPSRGSLPSAPQVGADGKLDFSQYSHPDEIPDGFHKQAAADPETFRRLLAGMGGGSDRATDGYNI